MKKSFLFALALATSLAACNNQPKKTKIAENVVGLKSDDKEFLALKDTAQHHLQEFIDSLAKHGADSTYRFAVKSDFVEGETHKHMWSQIAVYQSNKFDGIFIDSAVWLKNIKPGARVSIPKEDIEDWIMSNNATGKRVGGFSMEYLNSKQ